MLSVTLSGQRKLQHESWWQWWHQEEIVQPPGSPHQRPGGNAVLPHERLTKRFTKVCVDAWKDPRREKFDAIHDAEALV